VRTGTNQSSWSTFKRHAGELFKTHHSPSWLYNPFYTMPSTGSGDYVFFRAHTGTIEELLVKTDSDTIAKPASDTGTGTGAVELPRTLIHSL